MLGLQNPDGPAPGFYRRASRPPTRPPRPLSRSVCWDSKTLTGLLAALAALHAAHRCARIACFRVVHARLKGLGSSTLTLNPAHTSGRLRVLGSSPCPSFLLGSLARGARELSALALRRVTRACLQISQATCEQTDCSRLLPPVCMMTEGALEWFCRCACHVDSACDLACRLLAEVSPRPTGLILLYFPVRRSALHEGREERWNRVCC